MYEFLRLLYKMFPELVLLKGRDCLLNIKDIYILKIKFSKFYKNHTEEFYITQMNFLSFTKDFIHKIFLIYIQKMFLYIL